ncbi:hypothetical protein H1230_15490 [Paenibacillus sp. 19GGS1-52]|uniref:hypothetical protein n=1 Tax=Paenibacillus sp. 19GGS1-52 TaxID=2758563 RepID=UPI001EFA2C8B|nr:hypothetical protein [Paenibacillus sp. 19GGS1-52]ULO10043.1 hypothetical protein H1230_15490 [Paenibacillus sp. 19GGS1-52]
MKKNWISFLLLFVLMVSLGTEAFAANGETGAPVTGDTKLTSPISGQHQYGKLEAELRSGTYDVDVTLMELTPTGWVGIYILTATNANRAVSVNYYLEGGKQYRLQVKSQSSGWGHLYNYIP